MRASTHTGVVRPGLACSGLACLVVLALAGCGRRGPLELPPGAPPQQSAAVPSRIINDQDPPGLIQSPNRVIERTPEEKQQVFREKPAPRPINAPPAPKTGKSFILDPLL